MTEDTLIFWALAIVLGTVIVMIWTSILTVLVATWLAWRERR